MRADGDLQIRKLHVDISRSADPEHRGAKSALLTADTPHPAARGAPLLWDTPAQGCTGVVGGFLLLRLGNIPLSPFALVELVQSVGVASGFPSNPATLAKGIAKWPVCGYTFLCACVRRVLKFDGVASA